MIETICQGLKKDGCDVLISKLCGWFEIPRRTTYYKPTKAPPKVQWVYHADQGDDREHHFLWVSDGGASAGIQQKHCAVDLPA